MPILMECLPFLGPKTTIVTVRRENSRDNWHGLPKGPNTQYPVCYVYNETKSDNDENRKSHNLECI